MSELSAAPASLVGMRTNGTRDDCASERRAAEIDPDLIEA